MRGGLRIVAFAIAQIALFRAARRVRADAAMSVGFDVHARYVAHLPSVDTTSIDSPRRIPDATLQTGNAGSFVGVGFAWEAVGDDRLRFPLAGLAYDRSVGRSARIIDSLDGSLVHIETWRSAFVTILLPGIGVRFKQRRWMIEGAIQPGASVFLTKGQIVAGNTTNEVDFEHVDFVLRADLAVCRRLDPIERACLYVAPALYEFGTFNGGSLGLRWELGP